MAHLPRITHDPLLFGQGQTEGIVAVEYIKDAEGDSMLLYLRREADTVSERRSFRPFAFVSAAVIEGCPVPCDTISLGGAAPRDTLVEFDTWQAFTEAKTWITKQTGQSAGAPRAPFLFINDPVQQFLLREGETLFKEMPFTSLRRMQVDIECIASEGFDFCNAKRAGDRIIAIALADSTGWVEVLSGADMSEAAMLTRFVEIVQERDPDVLEGHNIFNFDLPYIATRAKREGVTLALGRDGSVPGRRPSRVTAGDRTVSYTRYDIHGRHVIDTLFLVQAYDVSQRALDGFGLKDVARHFGVSAPERTYIDGDRIGGEFLANPERVMKYAADDVRETGAVAALLSASAFMQTQMLPFSYQNVSIRGNATKIESLFLRAYLRERMSIPLADEPRRFAGGYTDMFREGVIRDVHHCDVRSLYPSLMLSRRIGPASDSLGVFWKLLQTLKDFRVEAKDMMGRATSPEDRLHFDALQSTFKILINSFYGYLGFSQGTFSDFAAAEEVAAQGRVLLGEMIGWLRAHGADPVEIDTDGVYFVPPALANERDRDRFREDFATFLPPGIEIEFDGEFVSMYSYKMKNYALLTSDGEMIVKGAALKSRGLEPFQRSFLRRVLRLKLEQRPDECEALYNEYVSAIRGKEWPIREFTKTEALRDSPEAYAQKVTQGRSRAAAYELAFASERAYKSGDHVSYYVTGEKKNVKVFEAARLVSEWDPERRDENVAYYLAKLDALYKKFAEPEATQGAFDLGV